MNAQQFDIFDFMYERFMFEKDNPIRLVELFSGIGFQRMGLELADIPYKVVATSEIDKFAIEAYEAIHGDNHNLGSITDITGKDMPRNIDLMTYSFPCTDLSKAGTQNGMGEETNSGLVYEVIRILDELKELDNLPKVLLMENVVDLIQVKFVKEFNEDIQKPLEKMGYTNYSFTMNARQYGVAQNRDRVFMVSILGEYNYIEPTPFKLENRLKNYLEVNVDESYFLSNDELEKVLKTDHLEDGPYKDFTKNITEIKDFRVMDFRYDEGLRERKDKISPTVVASGTSGISSRPLIKIPEMTTKGYAEAYDGDGVYINRPHQKRGVVQKGMIQTLKTSGTDVGVVVGEKYPKIRKLTSRETGRLMGMNDDQIDRQLAVVSNSQAYKQHGNGIVAHMIAYIVGMMYYETQKELHEIIQSNTQ